MRLIDRRTGLVFAIFLAGLGIAGTKALWLGVVQAGTLRNAAATQQKQTITVPARRGSITDRHEEELAVSQPAMSVAATPYLIHDPLKVANRISGLLGRDQNAVLADLSKKGTGFVWLARKLSIERAKQLQKMHIEGLDFVEESTRAYPRKFVASQLLGFTGTDGNGLAGLELEHEHELAGHDGKRLLVKDALGQSIKLNDEQPAIDGEDLKLTIDDRIQEETEKVLAEVGAKFKPAKGATAIVMNPHDGELLAVANWPRVDANTPGDAPDWAKQNRAVQTSYEPGSTFKAFTFAAALSEHKITPQTVFQLPAQIQVADRSIGEAHGESYGTLTAAGVLQKSSNVG
ncbi:MAG: peptidoglycan D,D-transpeptidase FtsI family protein, partial [Solirubrobacteraceae bacterium]